jgi:hypothetical protein
VADALPEILIGASREGRKLAPRLFIICLILKIIL